jgi:chromosome segregation ATPase
MASQPTGGGFDTLTQLIDASTALRTEFTRLTQELHTTVDDRNSLLHQLQSERAARKKAEDELSALRMSMDLREKQMRVDEEEIRRHREELAEQLKKMGKTLEELGVGQARRLSGTPSQPYTAVGAQSLPSAY